jgi:general secretion pathway protein K
MNAPSCSARQRGIALIVVLWLLVLLTVIAASYARIVRTETRLAANQVEASVARHLAEAGTQHAILELLVRDQTQRWRADGSIHRLRFADGTVDIAVRDARGLVDINRASPALLDTLLAGAGVAQPRRTALVDAILDWRDPDNLKHLNGAEDNDYRRAGLSWTARDASFSSIEELSYVLGMNAALFERLAPYLTVASGQAGVVTELAPPWLAGLLANGAGSGNRGTGADYHITVRASSGGGATVSLDTVVRIGAAIDRPYSILTRRSPALSNIFRPAGDARSPAPG